MTKQANKYELERLLVYIIKSFKAIAKLTFQNSKSPKDLRITLYSYLF